MSKAVISSGGKQFFVGVGDVVTIELIDTTEKTISFDPLIVIDGAKTTVGTPTVSGVSVTADIQNETRNDKVTSIRYKAKKRVHKLRGHRQRMQAIKITSIG